MPSYMAIVSNSTPQELVSMYSHDKLIEISQTVCIFPQFRAKMEETLVLSNNRSQIAETTIVEVDKFCRYLNADSIRENFNVINYDRLKSNTTTGIFVNVFGNGIRWLIIHPSQTETIRNVVKSYEQGHWITHQMLHLPQSVINNPDCWDP